MKNKKIIVAVSASIAAYKSASLVRQLIKKGAEVQVLMTQAATEFITPLTLSTLSKRPVLIDFVKDKSGTWNNHVELGLWADAMVIAPASANTLAKCANAICDNLVIATYLSARCPVFFAPAMDVDMYLHPSVQHNLKRLNSFVNYIIPSEHGELASGLIGEGRMAEPENIVTYLESFFNKFQPLQGKKAVITAGPTYESLDPVRFIGNHSTGKMGFAIAESLLQKGAEVFLIMGPSSLTIPTLPNLYVERVNSADQMYQATLEVFSQCDIAVLSAAVADYKPKVKATQKIKKKDEEFTIELVKNIDIAASLAKVKQPHQITVGFALETNDELANAQKKLTEKKFDFIVLNSLQDAGTGFGHDTNKVSFLDASGNIEHLELKSKALVAQDISNKIIYLIAKKSTG